MKSGLRNGIDGARANCGDLSYNVRFPFLALIADVDCRDPRIGACGEIPSTALDFTGGAMYLDGASFMPKRG